MQTMQTGKTGKTGKTRKNLPAALAIAFGLATAGCGGDDDSSTVAVTDPPAAPATDPVATGDVITVALSDFAFGGLPGNVPVGTRLEIENISESEMHELVAIRIPDDEDRSVEELLALPEEEIDAIFGATLPAMVLLAPPGAPQIEAVGDGTLDEPGRYAILCFIPTGVDPGEFMAAAAASAGGPPEIDGGPPHVVHGMYAEVLVG
jgi:hypothetical protein